MRLEKKETWLGTKEEFYVTVSVAVAIAAEEMCCRKKCVKGYTITRFAHIQFAVVMMTKGAVCAIFTEKKNEMKSFIALFLVAIERNRTRPKKFCTMDCYI